MTIINKVLENDDIVYKKIFADKIIESYETLNESYDYIINIYSGMIQKLDEACRITLKEEIGADLDRSKNKQKIVVDSEILN